MPCVLEVPSLNIIDTIRVPERGTEPKGPIVTDAEAPSACPAVKKMVAVRVDEYDSIKVPQLFVALQDARGHCVQGLRSLQGKASRPLFPRFF